MNRLKQELETERKKNAAQASKIETLEKLEKTAERIEREQKDKYLEKEKQRKKENDAAMQKIKVIFFKFKYFSVHMNYE